MADRTDTFNRSDSTSGMGTPSDGGSAWVEYGASDTWGVLSSKAYVVSNGGAAQALAALESSLSDVEVQLTCSTLDTSANVIILRLSNSSNYLHYQWDSSSGFRLFRVSGGGFTQIGSSAGSMSNGDTLKVSAVGDQINCYHNGALVIGPITSSHNQTETKHGLGCYNNAPLDGRWDDFSIIDAGGGGAAVDLLHSNLLRSRLLKGLAA